jgi:hypothetical protein
MYPASAALKSAILTDHIVVAKAEIWTSDQLLTTLDVRSGSVVINAKNSVRRTCSVELVTNRTSTNLVPKSDFDYLAPYGNELRLYRGVQFKDGTTEYVPLGVFVMTTVDISDSNEGVVIQIQGEDRSLLVTRAKWLEPYQMVSASLETAISAMLKTRYADIFVNFPTTNITIGQVVLGTDQDNDPWKDAVQLCEMVGYDLFFDADGVATMRQFPSLDGSVVVKSFSENSGTTITALQRSISTKETFNGIVYVVEGTQVTTPIRVTVWDEDSTSPTYRYGKFGQVPKFVKTNVSITSAAATTAAKNLLNTYIGSQEIIKWDGVVDPTLEAQDVVYVQANGSYVDRLVIIDSITIPMSPFEPMSAEARIVRVVATGETVVIGA